MPTDAMNIDEWLNDYLIPILTVTLTLRVNSMQQQAFVTLLKTCKTATQVIYAIDYDNEHS